MTSIDRPAGPVQPGAPTASWVEIDGDVPAELAGLARRCLAADGGVPLAAEPWFLRRRWGAVGGVRFGLRASDGGLVAAGVVCPGADGPIVTGLVDPGVRERGWSLLAELPEAGDAGFVTAAVGWIVQVGVVPAARGRGLGRALVTESLGRMAADGEIEAWLNVNVDNPGAAELYRRIGFTDRGRRARYQR